MAKVSDDARGSLITQQIGLLDMIVQAIPDNTAEWKNYVESTFPDVLILDGKVLKEDKSNISLKYMRCFRDSVFSGVTPSATLLAHIAEYFDKYLSGEHGLTLDESFDLKHKSRIGNPVAQKSWRHDKATVLFAIKIKREIAKINKQRLAIDDAAASVIEDWNLKADAEALKKEYIKEKIDKLREPVLPQTVEELEAAYGLTAVIYSTGKPLPMAPDALTPNKEAFEAYLESTLENLGE